MSWSEIELPFRIKQPILAVGADIKNSLCYAYDRSAFISQAVDNLEIPDNFDKFRKMMFSVLRGKGRQPTVIAYDMHPEYFSTKYVLDLPKKHRPRLVSVQHHHAHIASCMLENKLINQKVIGIAFDGTGFGDDNTLWGAEFLVADYRDFKRAAHLRYIPLLGGRQAILEPWRIACAWLRLALGRHFLDLNLLKQVDKTDWRVLEKMWKQGFNSPPASSIGRLFDAVAAIVLQIHRVRFEAEAAISLERIASGCKPQSRNYNFRIKRTGSVYVIDPVLTFRQIIADLENKRDSQEIAYSFHLTVAKMVKNTCLKIRDDTGINTVVLSGGVFQNRLLSKLSLGLLGKAGFRILTHKAVSCSDASVSLGQAAVAAFKN